jgi:hypothetical protein
MTVRGTAEDVQGQPAFLVGRSEFLFGNEVKIFTWCGFNQGTACACRIPVKLGYA